MTHPDRPLTDRDYRTLARFRTGLRRFLAFSEAAAKAEGITPAQHQLLLAIRGTEADQAPSASDLAEALNRQLHSTSELIIRAETRGLVTQTTDEGDHRRRLVELTPEGVRIIERLSAIHRRELRSFRTDLTAILEDLI